MAETYPDCTPALLRDWQMQFDEVYYSRCFGWKEFLDNPNMDDTTPENFFACRHCKERVKFTPAERSFGGIHEPTTQNVPVVPEPPTNSSGNVLDVQIPTITVSCAPKSGMPMHLSGNELGRTGIFKPRPRKLQVAPNTHVDAPIFYPPPKLVTVENAVGETGKNVESNLTGQSVVDVANPTIHQPKIVERTRYDQSMKPLSPIPENCFLRSPSVILDAQVVEDTCGLSAGNVDFCQSVQIRAPSERQASLPQHRLMHIVSAAEQQDIMTRVGTPNRPDFFPIRDSDWRIPGALKQETTDYIALLHNEFSVEALDGLVQAGDALLKACGSLEDAARQVQEHNFRIMDPIRQRIEHYRYLYPAIASQVIEIATAGVIPEYTGPENPLPRESGLPYDRSKSLPIMKKFWKLIREGKMIVSSNAVAEEDARRQPCPTSAVQKKLPDRSLSVDFRVISDLRRVNLGFDVEQFFPVVTPNIVQVAQGILKLKAVFPSPPVHICKRDIDSAFHRVFIHPDLCKLLRHEFTAMDLGLTNATYETINCSFLVLPFGWIGSPFYFALMTEAIMAIHANFRPSQPRWSGSERFSCFLYVDDAI